MEACDARAAAAAAAAAAADAVAAAVLLTVLLRKPADWEDAKEIPDPMDVKPEGYDDIPAQIPDPEAEQPDDWDEEDDGAWEPPMIDNPDYQGPWTPKMYVWWLWLCFG